jgi:hypothetical protein
MLHVLVYECERMGLMMCREAHRYGLRWVWNAQHDFLGEDGRRWIFRSASRVRDGWSVDEAVKCRGGVVAEWIELAGEMMVVC